MIACDDRYAPHAAVVLLSLLSHTPGEHELVVLSHMSARWEARLVELVQSCGQPLQLVPLRQVLEQQTWQQLTGQPDQISVPHASSTIAARLLVDQLLPGHIRRMLYLDCDLVVQSDLSPLLNQPLGDRVLAAAPDALLTRMAHQRLNFPPDHVYFNSGVLLVDLDQWRRLDLDSEALAIAADSQTQGKLLYPDQDVLNLIAVRHGYQRLNSHWNHQLIHGAQASLESADTAPQPPAIVHFAGEVKPWKSWYPQGAAHRAYWYWRQQVNQRLGDVVDSQPDQPSSARDHWVAFQLLHRHKRYEQASHCAAALLQGLPAPPP